MEYRSLEGSSVIRKFSILFLLVSIIPFLFLFFIYQQVSENTALQTAIGNMEIALALVAFGVGAGYLAIRAILKDFINTTMINRKDMRHLISASPDQHNPAEKNEVSLLKQTFDDIRTKLEDDIRRLDLSKRTLHSVLSKVGQEVTTDRSLDSSLQLILETLTDALFSRVGVIFMTDTESQEIFIRSVTGLDPALYLDKRYSITLESLGVLAANKDSALLPPLTAVAKQHLPFLNEPAVFAPIVIREQIMGGIVICSRKIPDPFQEDDFNLLNSVVLQTTIAIDNEDLKFKANIDALTGLFNYRHFITMLDYEINRVKRYGGQLALLMLDVDNFKTYNDTFGHVESNLFLHNLAGVISATMRSTDVVCRYGGDELVIILPETDAHGLTVVATRLKSVFTTANSKMKVTLSGGGVNWSAGMERAQFIEAADKLLYQAKEQGKDRIIL
ncbi:MAG: sensor domain-containing diguanylate cyclase [Candidatus Omnitrophica bacterium]|nr:sensor domain-containing diguanylate cyclase [Candidatus Omnitrophota bacterium]